MNEKFTDFDPAELLGSEEAIKFYLEDAFDTSDAAQIATALGVVARAKGMTKVARDTGLAREQLYRSLSETGNPTLETTLAVLKSFGLQLTSKQRAA
ncbi:putative addiction module antidote protein [Siculibacillus lacustris]|uniref:Putative addiction module antidote protein n=1 Tax=Siculibacillus lacustris TaxID=1549641 RepID=A0A4Q9VDF1_9HYPH|nr:addiction module antidote protein [Siculibacillus lacustris]TBW32694.1 putative addiction module antidote protein [Siculibacillus lacustris]